MKNLLAVVIFICGLCSGAHAQEAADSTAFADADWTVEELGKGAVAKYAQMSMFGAVQNICVIKYPASRYETKLVYSPGEDADITSRLAEDAGADFAMNASYFNVKTHYSTVYCKVGGEVLYSMTNPREAYRVNGIIGLKDRKGRKITIEACDTSDYSARTGKWHSAIAAGPVLMKDGDIVVPRETGDAMDDAANIAAMKEEARTSPGTKVNYSSAQFYDKRHPRSVMGIDEDGWVYLAVIDGRSAGNAAGTTIYETACICRLLGMSDAINLDGGGSSVLWTEDTGVLSHPSDNKIFDHDGERVVPSIIAVF